MLVQNEFAVLAEAKVIFPPSGRRAVAKNYVTQIKKPRGSNGAEFACICFGEVGVEGLRHRFVSLAVMFFLF